MVKKHNKLLFGLISHPVKQLFVFNLLTHLWDLKCVCALQSQQNYVHKNKMETLTAGNTTVHVFGVVMQCSLVCAGLFTSRGCKQGFQSMNNGAEAAELPNANV